VVPTPFTVTRASRPIGAGHRSHRTIAHGMEFAPAGVVIDLAVSPFLIVVALLSYSIPACRAAAFTNASIAL
jgi:hypothetical protein